MGFWERFARDHLEKPLEKDAARTAFLRAGLKAHAYLQPIHRLL